MSNPPLSRPSIIEIQGVVQRYAWGKRGSASRVGELSGEGAHEPETPFAEMWFGAHPSSPSPILTTNLLPDQVTATDLFQFASSSHNASGPTLPFLMKVLSVGAPLSIQLHPNKRDAEQLHTVDPTHYPDNNHKPELAVALTDVELVCGIRPLSEVDTITTIIPRLQSITRHTTHIEKPSERAVEIFRSLFTLSDSDRRRIVEEVVKTESSSPILINHLRWVREAAKKNKVSDPGLIGILLLNHLALTPGECVYIAPGIPHAYMTGDLVECMASSDNVVRAGLTEKYIDISTFIRLVRYDPLETPRLNEKPGVNKATTTFIPPAPDFKLTRVNNGTLDLAHIVKAPAIIMCQSGKALLTQEREKKVWPLTAGGALFVSQFEGSLLLSGEGADLFIASANDTF